MTVADEKAELGRIWVRQIRRGEDAKKDYVAQADETLSYFKAVHKRLYESPATRDYFAEFDGSACVSVCKAGQARGVLGPFLYQKNPRRVVRTRSNDAVKITLAHVLQSYLNYTPREGHLQAEARRAIDDALMRGVGFLRTGFDPERRIATSWYVSSADVVIDPDARCLEEALWVAVKHRETLWQLRSRVLDRARGQDRVESTRDKTVHRHEAQARAALREIKESVDRYAKEGTERRPDGVTTWTVWSKLGKGWRSSDDPEDHDREDDAALFYQIEVLDRDAPAACPPLYCGPWDTRIYLDDAWPLTPLAFVPTLDELWPVSVFGQGRSHMAAIDLLASVSLHLAKVHARDIYFTSEAIEPDDLQRVVHGGLSEVIHAKTRVGERLSDVIHRFDTGAISAEVQRQIDWHEYQFGMTTGMTDALSGAARGAEGVERSATAANLKHQAGVNRLSVFREDVEQWAALAARAEAIFVRTDLDPDEVEVVVGETMEMPYLVSVRIGHVELPLRPVGDLEGLAPGAIRSVADVLPEVATYFATEQEAQAAADLWVQAFQQRAMGDPDVAAQAAMLLPAMAQGQGVGVRKVKVADVWRDTAGMSPRDLVREYAYEVAVGSTRRLDPQARIEQTKELMNNVLPVLLQTGNFQAANKVLQTWQDANDVPHEDRAEIAPPPAPPPPPGGPPPGQAEGGMPPGGMPGGMPPAMPSFGGAA